jgi:hypothetical protein
MTANIKLAPDRTLLRVLSLLPALLLSTPLAFASGSNHSRDHAPLSPTKIVVLGTAGNFAILTETGITDVPSSVVRGNIGVSPITGAADLLSCAEVTGKVYSVDNAGPAPCSIMDPTMLTTAVNDMQAAYTDAAGRTPTVTNLGGGNIGGLTLPPGVYNWNSGVTIASNVTLSGPKGGVWIFQIAGDLTVATGVGVLLSGNPCLKHIFWQVAGATNLGTSSLLQGTVLDATAINLGTDATIKGRLLAQTAVTLQMNTITTRK